MAGQTTNLDQHKADQPIIAAGLSPSAYGLAVIPNNGILSFA